MAATPVTQNKRFDTRVHALIWRVAFPGNTSDHADIRLCTAGAYKCTAMAWQTGEAMFCPSRVTLRKVVETESWEA